MRINEKDLKYLAFLQEQMEVRESKEEGKIGKDERCTAEFLMLNMAWQEFLKTHFGLYPALDACKPFGSGKNKELWIKVQKYRLAGK